MARSKLAITLDSELVAELDALVAQRRYPNRSRAIEAAVAEKLDRLSHRRLALEVAKLDPGEEKAIADEGLGAELATWPEY